MQSPPTTSTTVTGHTRITGCLFSGKILYILYYIYSTILQYNQYCSFQPQLLTLPHQLGAVPFAPSPLLSELESTLTLTTLCLPQPLWLKVTIQSQLIFLRPEVLMGSKDSTWTISRSLVRYD